MRISHVTSPMIVVANPIRIPKELHRVNLNGFTVYYDLDHLSKELKRGWGG